MQMQTDKRRGLIMKRQSQKWVVYCIAVCTIMVLTANAQPLRVQWAKPAIPEDTYLRSDAEGEYIFTDFYFWDQTYKKLIVPSMSLWMCLDASKDMQFCGFVQNMQFGLYEVFPIGWVNDSVLLMGSIGQFLWYNVPSGTIIRKVKAEKMFFPWSRLMVHSRKQLVLETKADILEGMKLNVWDFDGKLQRVLADSAMRIFGDRRIWIATLRTNSNLDFCVVVYVPEHNYYANDTTSVLVRKINLDTWEVEKEFVVGPLYEGAVIRSLSLSGRFAVLDYGAEYEDYLLDLETGAVWKLGGKFAAILPDDRTVTYFGKSRPWLGQNEDTLYVARLLESGGLQVLNTFVRQTMPNTIGFRELYYTVDYNSRGDTLYLSTWDGLYILNWRHNQSDLIPYWRASMYAPHPWPVWHYPGYESQYYSRKGMIEISPGGEYLRVMAATGGVEIFRTADGRRVDGLSELVLTEGRTLDRKLLPQLKRYPYAFAFSWDDQMVAIGGYPQTDQVSIYRLPQWSLQYRYQVNWDITAVDFSPDGKSFAIGGKDGRIRICDYYSGNVRRTLQAPPSGEVALVRYCRSGRHLYVVLRQEGGKELIPLLVDVNTGEWKDFSLEIPPAFNYPLDIWQMHLVFNREKLLIRKVDSGGEVEYDWYDCEEGEYHRIRGGGVPIVGTPYVLRSPKGYKVEVVDTVDYRVVAEYDRFLPKQDTAIQWEFWRWNRDSVWLRWDQLVYGSGGWIAGVMKEPPALFVLHWTPPEPTEVERDRGRAEALPVGWYWVEVYNVLGQRVSRQWEFVRTIKGVKQRLRLPVGIYFVVVRDSQGEVKWKGQYRVSLSTREK